jgi:iron(III) transport system ATP-binding protein
MERDAPVAYPCYQCNPWFAFRAQPVRVIDMAAKTHCAVQIRGLTKHFGSAVAVAGVSLDIAAGELFFLLGPSGCGKTTLLRMLAGFVVPDSGDIFFGEERITALPPRSRDAGLVFQTYALWPHMTVADNVAYGLRVRGLPRREIDERVAGVLKLVQMDGFDERRPNQLSGGQQQRIALARALVIEPRVLLLDEPLSNLDARLRDEMREEIRRLHDETGLTMIYVTHDQKEALALANRLAVMDHGTLVQVGTPREVYERPATRFVANFLGDSNFIPGTVRGMDGDGCIVDTAVGALCGVPARDRRQVGDKIVCSIRPHVLALNAPAGAPNRIEAKVTRVAFLGELLHLGVLAGETALDVVSLAHIGGHLHVGDAVQLSAPMEQVVVLAE